MPGYRAERIAEMIHRELSQRLRLEIKDPRITPISITSVRVSRDLSIARIAYMPLGGGEVSDDLREGLEEAARRLRGPIGRALRLRHAPALRFEEDRTTEEAIRVTRLIEELARQRDEST